MASKRSISSVSNSPDKSAGAHPKFGEKSSPAIQEQKSKIGIAGLEEKDKEKNDMNNAPANAFLMALRELIAKAKPVPKPSSPPQVKRSVKPLNHDPPSAPDNTGMLTMKSQMLSRAKEVRELLQKVLSAVSAVNPFKPQELLPSSKQAIASRSHASDSSESSDSTGDTLASSGQDQTLRSEDKSLVQSVASSRQSSKQTLSLKFQMHLQRVGLFQIFTSDFLVFYSFYLWALVFGVAYVWLKSSILIKSTQTLKFADLLATQTSIYGSFVQTLISKSLYTKESTVAGFVPSQKYTSSILFSIEYDQERYEVLKRTYLETIRTEDSPAWTTQTQYYRGDGVLVTGSMGTEILDLLSQYKEYTTMPTPMDFESSPELPLISQSYASFLSTVRTLSSTLSETLTSQQSLQSLLSWISLGLSALFSAGLLYSLLRLRWHTKGLWIHTQQVFYRFAGDSLKKEVAKAASSCSVPLDRKIFYPKDSKSRRKKASNNSKQPNPKDHTTGNQNLDNSEAKFAKTSAKVPLESIHMIDEAGKSSFKPDVDTINVSEHRSPVDRPDADAQRLKRGKGTTAKTSSTSKIRVSEERVSGKTSTTLKLVCLGLAGLVLMNLATIVDVLYGAVERKSLNTVSNARNSVSKVLIYGRSGLISVLARIAKLPDKVVQINQVAPNGQTGRYTSLLELYTDLSAVLGVGFFQNPLCTEADLKFGLVERCQVVSQGFTGYTLQNAINGVDVVTQDASQNLDPNSSFLAFDSLLFSPITTDILEQRLMFALNELAAKYDSGVSSYLAENISFYVAVMIASLIILALLNHCFFLQGEFFKWKMAARTFSVLPRDLLTENNLMKIHFEKLIVAYL